MRLSNGFVIDKEKTFGELKFTAVRDVFLQNEDGTPSTQLKKRIYDLKCSLHGGIIPVSVPPEVPLREFPYNAVVELVNPVADTVSRKTYTGADVDCLRSGCLYSSTQYPLPLHTSPHLHPYRSFLIPYRLRD